MKLPLSLFAFLVWVHVSAQRPAGYVPVGQLKRAEARIDSLSELVDQLNVRLNAASQKIIDKENRIFSLDSVIRSMQSDTARLNQELHQYRSHNLKLDQSNRILIVFNSIVGFLLLITLVWFVRNLGKKKSKILKQDKLAGAAGTSAENSLRSIESKLEQLERLNRLREKGILNDQEFENEKKQILG